MKCDKKDIERDELIDRYLRNELSDLEADNFENHLLFCSLCQKELTERNRISGEIQKYWARKTFQHTGQIRNLPGRKKTLHLIAFVAVAAGIALVIGLFLYPDRPSHPGTAQTADKGMKKDSAEVFRLREEEGLILPETAVQRLSAISNPDLENLMEYHPNPLYESQIGVNMRSAAPVIDHPPDSMQCRSGSNIEFRYLDTEPDSLFLAILNNLGEVVREERIASPHILKMEFPKGLYYWQLTNDQETLHTGKIYLLKR